jgi:hypothetical protein
VANFREEPDCGEIRGGAQGDVEKDCFSRFAPLAMTVDASWIPSWEGLGVGLDFRTAN